MENTSKRVVTETQGTWQTGGEHREIVEDIEAAVLTTAAKWVTNVALQ